MSTRHPTPAQIARNGHVTVLVRKLLQERGWNPSDLAKEVGMPPTQAYQWSHGTAGVGLKHRNKLARVLGCKPDELAPREGDALPPRSELLRLPAPTPVRRVGEVLQLTVLDTGEARIRLDVTLPLAQAMPLVRLLLDAEAVQRSALTREGDPDQPA